MSVKTIKRQLLAAVAMVLVSAIALSSSTFAWFVQNQTVTAQMTNISSSTSSGDLYIAKTAYKTAAFTIPATAERASMSEQNWNGTASLYPASANLTSSDTMGEWYVAADNAGAITFEKYIKLTDSVKYVGKAVNTIDGTYSQNGATVAAYKVVDYWLYTSHGNQKIYLNGDSAITFGGNESLQPAVRMAVTAVDNTNGTETLKFVYSPANETQTGNSKNAQNGFNYVNSTTSVTQISAVSGSSASTAGKMAYGNGNVGTYKYWAANNNAGNGFVPNETANTDGLGTAGDTAGNALHLRVYIWMEGTDAEAVIGQADGQAGMTVSVKFAGITIQE